ncbi:hypothetical protein DENSPDRAFT_883046 [Dentipellis sp. KUC8613]|nr:hypothetical protein DENSPDRAFT_883046 [Dentipellis sp. KUC8613]
MSSRRKEFTSPQYVKDAITAAYSTTYNPRNVEEPFYTPFCETMSKLAELSPDPLGGTLSVNLEELPEDEARNVHPDGYSDDEDQGGIGARVAKRRRLNVIESPEGAVPVHLVQNALVSFRNLDQDDLDHVDEPDSDGEPGDEDGAGNVGEVNEDDDLGKVA